MAPRYESVAAFYPLNPNITSSGTLFSGESEYLFGSSSDVDRILSIANSSPLKLYIIHKFGLFQHYEIDSSREKFPIFSILNEFEDNYTFEKNDKGAVVITVQDKDRFMASQIANEIVNKIDQTNRDLLNENKRKILIIYEKKLSDKETEVKSLTDTIFNLKHQFNLYTSIADLDEQVQKSRNVRGAEYDEASERVKVLEEKKKGAIRELNNSIVQFEQYKASINTDVPTLFILEKAYPAEKKSKPVRWLIVVGTALITFILSALAVLLIERFKAIKASFQNA